MATAFLWNKVLPALVRQRDRRRAKQRKQRFCPRFESLEDRLALAAHEWTGQGLDNLWSNDLNWTNGSPATDVSGDIDLIFHSNLADPLQLVTENDISGLTVDSITFDANAGTGAAGGTTADGYTINGLAITIDTSAAGQDPFGIDITTGVADPLTGVTQTFNVDLILANADATFRSQAGLARLDFTGNIDLGTQTLTVDNLSGSATPSVTISGAISNGNVIKVGTGELQLSGNNSYADTTVNNGRLFADTNTALGAAAGTLTVNDPAQIKLRNGVTVEKTLLNLNSNTSGGGLGVDGNTTNTFRGDIVLMAGVSGVALGAGNGVANAGARLVVDGVISGATSTLFINGAGTVQFTRNNTYTGVTRLNNNQGISTLQIDTPAGLGAGGAANATEIERSGAGPAGGTVLLNFSGTLQDAAMTAENINFAGAGVNSLGAIRSLGDSNVIIPGDILFRAGAPWFFGVDGAQGSITTTGIIDEDSGAARALTKVGEGTLELSGATPNAFNGGASVLAGTLLLNKSAAPLGNAGTAIANGTVTIGNLATPGGPNSAVVRLGSNFQLGGTTSSSSSVVIGTDGLLDLNGVDMDRIGSATALTMTSGIVSLASSRLFVDGDIAINAGSSVIAGTTGVVDLDGAGRTINVADGGTLVALAEIANGGIIKEGAGTLILGTDNTYSGTTIVNAGVLTVNGSQPQSTIQLNANATLGGTGIVGPVTSAGGAVSPGASAGILTVVGGVILDANSTFTAEVNGNAVGTNFDHLVVTGGVSLNDAELDLQIGFQPAVGRSFVLINNDGNDPVVGTFNGLLEGATLTIGATIFNISYQGGDGNDVVLLAQTRVTPLYAVSVDAGLIPRVKVFNPDGTRRFVFLAYPASFLGGVRVATGDVNQDGVDDIITGPGAGSNLPVKVFDGNTGALTQSFFAFGGFRGGVFVASGDTNGDSFADIIVGADAGIKPRVKVFSGQDGSVVRNFLAYDAGFTGGVRVAAGDVDNDGFADIITSPGLGIRPEIKVFDGEDNALLRSFFIYGANFRGGVFVGAGDVNGDGFADIVTGSGAGAVSRVRVFSGQGNTSLHNFLAFGDSFRGGVRVAVGDVNGDGEDEILIGAENNGPRFKAIDATTEDVLQSFFAFSTTFRGGVFVG